MTQADLAGVLLIFHWLLATKRAGWKHRGSTNPESTSDHTASAMVGILVQSVIARSLDHAKKVVMDTLVAAFHDLDECGLPIDETPYRLPGDPDKVPAFFSKDSWVKSSSRRAGRSFAERKSYVADICDWHRLSAPAKRFVVDLWTEYNDPNAVTRRAARVRAMHALNDAVEAVVQREWTPGMLGTQSFIDQASQKAVGLDEAVKIVTARHAVLTG